MSTRLIKVLQFVDVAPGATVSLPHGLNENGTAVIPDRLDRSGADASLFTISADLTNVTVKNNGGGDASVDVLVQRWHSTQRQLGGDPGPDALAVQPFEPSSAAGGAAGGPDNRLVYRPGAVGVDAPGYPVFTDWTLLYDALEEIRPFGRVILEFDSRFSPIAAPFGQTAQIPARPDPNNPGFFLEWDMFNVTWRDWSRPPGEASGETTISFADNCVVRRLATISSVQTLNIWHDGQVNTPILTSGPYFDGADIFCYNTDPLAKPMFGPDPDYGFTVPENNGVFAARLGNGQTSPAPLFDMGDNVALFYNGGSQISDNLFVGNPGSILIHFVSPPGGHGVHQWKNPLAPMTIIHNELAHFGFSRVMAYTVDPGFSTSTGIPQTADVNPARYNNIIPVDTSAGPLSVTLPLADPAIGEVVFVKDVAGACGQNPVTIVPSGADVVESPFLATPFGLKGWHCDGIGNWRAIEDRGNIVADATLEAANFNVPYDTAKAANAGVAGITATLPDPSIAGRTCSVHNVAGAAGPCAIATAAGAIVGAISLAAGQTARYVSDGVGAGTWVQVA